MRKLVQSGKITKEDRYVEQLNQAFVNLNEYVKNNPSMLTISRSELNGIKTLLGSRAAYQKKKTTRRLPLIAV
jgi:hypothetical protein